ncbi:MAG: helix-turn-helix domain-containing protein [Pseudomonadota bacterium]
MTDLSLRSYGDATLSHAHDFHQAVLALKGSLEMEVAGRGGRVEGCALVAVAPGRLHSCRASGPNRFLVLDWEGEDGEAVARLMGACEREPFLALDPRLLPLLRFLERVCADEASAAEAMGPEERRDWGRLLLRRLGSGIERRPFILVRRLDRALAFIEANKAERLTVERIAAAAHTSAGHLHALFRRHLGVTPMDHLGAIRLDHAMGLLASSDVSIAAVAAASGYADQSALTRAFKRRCGMTPARYRQSQRLAAPPEARSKRSQPRPR